MIIDKGKIESIIDILNDYDSKLDNILYRNYSAADLKIELDKISHAKSYMESLIQEKDKADE